MATKKSSRKPSATAVATNTPVPKRPLRAPKGPMPARGGDIEEMKAKGDGLLLFIDLSKVSDEQLRLLKLFLSDNVFSTVMAMGMGSGRSDHDE